MSTDTMVTAKTANGSVQAGSEKEDEDGSVLGLKFARTPGRQGNPERPSCKYPASRPNFDVFKTWSWCVIFQIGLSANAECRYVYLK